MKKHLFLTGPSGVGKTTLIREVLAPELAYAGGFVTERALGADGALLGYDLYPAAAAADFSLYDGRRFLDYCTQPPSKDNEVFRGAAVQLLQEAEHYPYAMIDEFGGFELLIPQFRDALADFLNLELPIIGVIKAAGSVEELQVRFGLGERFPGIAAMVRDVIAADADTEIVEMTRRGEERVRALVRRWAEEYLHA